MSETLSSNLSLNLLPATSPWFALWETLITGSDTAKLQAIAQLGEGGDDGLRVLQEFLLIQGLWDQTDNPVSEPCSIAVVGTAYQTLRSSSLPGVLEFLAQKFPNGVVPLESATGVDYRPLQECLAQQDFQRGDRLTLEKLCELAGSSTVERGWLYFTEVEGFSSVDLQTVNNLWLAHSQGKFGFSVQRTLWLGVGKNWERLWPKIGWKSGNQWTRYPQEFTWDLTAPLGHLPLSNQLRGVRTMASLLSHPAWS